MKLERSVTKTEVVYESYWTMGETSVPKPIAAVEFRKDMWGASAYDDSQRVEDRYRAEILNLGKLYHASVYKDRHGYWHVKVLYHGVLSLVQAKYHSRTLPELLPSRDLKDQAMEAIKHHWETVGSKEYQP